MELSKLENRPLPYSLTEANLLRQVKESAAEGLFKSFQLLLGKDVRENSVKFEVLLGVYTNAIQFVKFLETALAISCINTEFRDLKRMVDGKIQFKISVPTIAHSDGRRPNKQKQYIVMKTCNKHHISAEMELSMTDLENMHMDPETSLDITEYIGTVKTITSALQFGVDAMERGLVDTVLTVKLRHAPPLFILQSLSDPVYTERGLKKTVKADLVAMFKDHLINHSFFMDKSEFSTNSKQYIIRILSDLINSVSKETVFKGMTTYTTDNNEPITGVIETTDNIMRKLLSILGEYRDSVVGPAAYASYVIRGENLVTAVSYGRAMKSFENFMNRLVDNPTQQDTIANHYEGLTNNYGSLPKTTIPISVIKIGNQNIALESLQRMYNEAQCPFPLNRRMQYAYYFPVGLYMSRPRYTTSTMIKMDDDNFLSTEAWVVNKNNTPLCFNYQNCLRTICHPRVHNPGPTIQALQIAFPEIDEALDYGVQSQPMDTMNLFELVEDFYDKRHIAVCLPMAQTCNMSTEDFLHPTNHKLLRMELNPMFDFYAEMLAGNGAAYRHAHRTMSGNIPQPLAPIGFQDARGKQLESAVNINHVIDDATLEIIQSTAFDATYPILCYIVEAMIHGQKEKFLMNIPLIALCINTYWANSGHVAFVNSFFMVKNICTYMGSGIINKELYAVYRKIIGEIVTLKHALMKMIGTESMDRVDIQGYVNAIFDNNLLPPFAYDDIFSHLLDENIGIKFRVGDTLFGNGDSGDDFIETIMDLEASNNVAANIYNARNTVNYDHYQKLQLAAARDNMDSLILEKIYYYIFLPVCTNGHMCGMGADFEHIAMVLGYNAPVFGRMFNGSDSILENLENGTLRDVLIASEINPTIEMLRTLTISYINCPQVSQAVRVIAERDPCQRLGSERNSSIEHTVLVNSFVCFGIPERIRPTASTIFYPIPFHQFYCDPLVAANWNNPVQTFVMANSGQRMPESFNVPDELMAEYTEWHKAPMTKYITSCRPTTNTLSTLAVMHNKLSPIAFICQAKNKIHPGFSLTVVRMDEVLSENMIYSSRASTSVFVGQPVVSRREVRADAVGFDIHHELASLDTGLKYSSATASAHVATITTDMGIHCQNLFATFPNELYNHADINNYIAQKIGVENVLNRRDPRTFIAGIGNSTNLPGVIHGQFSVCEIILTPVTADVSYFQKPNSPRGRASCVVSCDVSNHEKAEQFLYDHSLPDPAHEYRSTVNPWASQRGSLGDILYNSTYRQVAAPGIYSPCKPFFNKEELLKNNKSFYTMVNEYSQRVGGYTTSSNTELQYVVINGTDLFLEQPCMFLQEAFPTLSASHRAMLDEYMSAKTTHAPVHLGQYFIEETAPVKRVLKIGNKFSF
ncbi:major capsid protein [Suid gammaherpesvirus 3]|uniref:Major capsid protein n=1 Tax=Suid gammaherpesvirus 3 TaxID=1960249 RepID=Q8JYC8_9GAMA|nr:major capsid protein [Porcine lymphotropic herpesvirus 1]AAM22125.1 major capsid protein [Porcine lymphotropic herpesvirus 1]